MANWLDDRAERQQRTADAAADRRRQDAITAAEVDAVNRRTDLETRQLETEQRDKRRRDLRREQERDRAAARARRKAMYKALRTWASDHIVHLMIYPLAVFSAWMAIPAMAHFGHKVYGSATGVVLPVITELGMWAFAFAVQLTRHRHPDRPVWALQLGVLIFTGIGGALNYLDGATDEHGAVWRGLVMGVVSVAGVVAHQLVEASPRRSRAERDHATVTRHAARKIAAVRRSVINDAVARVDAAGQTTLLFAAGDYAFTTDPDGKSRRVLRGKGKRMLRAVEPTGDTTVDEMDRRIRDLLDNPIGPPDGDSITTPVAPRSGASIPTSTTPPILTSIGTSPIDTNSDVDQPGSTPTDATDRPRRSTPRGSRDRGRARGADRGDRRTSQARSIEELRAALVEAIADPTIDVDPTSAESIRRALRCSPKRARELRHPQ